MDKIVAALSDFAAKLPAARDLLDLYAQQDMAHWAKWMFWATVASVLLSAAALIAAYRSLRLSRKAVADTREIGEFQTQAYVHASEARFGQRQNILITCKNGGQTPATHFMVNAAAQVVKRGTVSASIEFHNTDFKTWSALGANSELSASVLQGDINVSRMLNGQLSPDSVLLVSGQIIYCTVFNHDHLTQFAFYVERLSGKFLRPTANLITFWRIPATGVPSPAPSMPVLLEGNE